MSVEQLHSTILASRNYVIGRRFEYRVQNYLRKLGYYVIRSYGSKGLFDLIAVPLRGIIERWPDTLLIQCKNHGVISKKELNNLVNNDKWNGLILIVSSNKSRKLEFKNLRGQIYGM